MQGVGRKWAEDLDVLEREVACGCGGSKRQAVASPMHVTYSLLVLLQCRWHMSVQTFRHQSIKHQLHQSFVA
jgi:hypothetical protein